MVDPTALEVALAAASWGWSVFPVVKGGKHPACAGGFTSATSAVDRIRAWAVEFPDCNWGVACGASDLLVVDADPRNGADVAAIHAALPLTLTADTGGGGRHWFFKGARKCPARLAQGVDVKSTGGYVLLPGSFTSDDTRRDSAGKVHGTGSYRWGPPAGLLEVPGVVLAAIDAAAPARTADADDAELPEGLALGHTWAAEAARDLAALPPAVKGDGGTPALWAASVAIRGWLLDLTSADRVLRAVWCTRCSPPWTFDAPGDERNWWHTLERARDGGGCEWGSRLPLVGLDRLTDPLQAAIASVALPTSDLPPRVSSWNVHDGDLAGAPANVERAMRKWRSDQRGGGQSHPELRESKAVLTWLVKVREVTPMVIRQEFGPAAGDFAESICKPEVQQVGILEQIDGVIRACVNGSALRWNDMLLRCELNGRAWSDDMTAAVRLRCEQLAIVAPDKSVKRTDVEERVQSLAKLDSYHPVRDYLASLKWDGTSRLDGLFPMYFGAVNSPLNRALGVCFALGAVRRVLQPGAKVDMLPILYGPQGAFKSTAIRELAGPAFFSDAVLNFSHRSENAMTLAGCWILEVPELEGMNRAEQNAVKAFVTVQVDRVLLPYARTKTERPRMSVMIGTTNDERPLRDPTGSRRYPVITVGAIAIDQLARDRDQLWAEAVVRAAAGEKHWLDSAMHEQAERVNEDHTQVNESVEDALRAWLVRTDAARWLSHFDHPTDGTFTVRDALLHGLNVPVAQQSHSLQTSVGIALRKLGVRGSRSRIRLYRFSDYTKK